MTKQVVDASAGGSFLTAGGRAHLSGVSISTQGADVIAVVREGSGAGRILASLAALAGTSRESLHEVSYTGNVHVTVTGAGATVLLYQR